MILSSKLVAMLVKAATSKHTAMSGVDSTNVNADCSKAITAPNNKMHVKDHLKTHVLYYA